MTTRSTRASAARPNGPAGRHIPDAANLFQIAGTLLDYQQQMLGLATRATDGMRMVMRQPQRRMGYMSALSHCRDLPPAGALTAEFMQRTSQDASGEWKKMAHPAERWLNAADQNSRRMLESLEANRREV